MVTETVLIVGATGNIGVAAALAVLRTKRQVLAIVRNQASATKLLNFIGSSEGIVTVQADVVSPTGVQSVVDQVRAGKLPAFQHVISAVGGVYNDDKMYELTQEDFKWNMEVGFDANFYAYRATVPYLLEQNHPKASFVLQTGYQGELGLKAGAGMSQSALFGMATAAIRELADTNIRFNEIRLGMRVEIDASAEANGTNKVSRYAEVYEKILDSPDMRGGLIKVLGPTGLDTWQFEKNPSALIQIQPPKVRPGTFQDRR